LAAASSVEPAAARPEKPAVARKRSRRFTHSLA
jgi:hypothetical protein